MALDQSVSPHTGVRTTVKPDTGHRTPDTGHRTADTGHRIKRTPSIKRTVAGIPKFISLFTLNETFIKRTPP